ncbi:MAG: UDP-N-acetylmuramoyl-tripeptide--D-alanyl-D-alanine ligase [Clostridiales bacterium]|nr:UDP-N-acetylmuramoyl-tripeptide--D-alanyl-D-alanine ligase [Clostridiales bacterium]
MLTLPVDKLVSIVGGELLAGSPDAMVNGVAIDSREVEPGGAFFALPGGRTDGHEHFGEAVEAGARALIVTRPDADLAELMEAARRRGVAVVRVPDTLAAIQRLATFHRSRLFCPVIGVTGSTGKTTTKEYLVSVLGTCRKVVATAGNRNNELGVPLTVLEAGADTDVLVVEMAMRGTGEIAELARIASPTMGIVTNIGVSHIELLGSQEAIASAKGELIEAIPADGTVFLNGDDAFSSRLATKSSAPVVRYGLSEACEVRAEEITVDAASLAHFSLVLPQVRVSVQLSVPGRHNVYNALAAAAVADALGFDPFDIAAGLSVMTGADMRMQAFVTASGIHVINDAYNANPASMRAAVDTLAEMRAEGRTVAVLGDMAELGSLTELAHFQLGEHVARAGIGVLVTVGERARRVAEGARAVGMDSSLVRPCVTAEEASEVLDDTLEPGDIVLVKASRVMRLERVVEGIVEPRV